MAAPDGGGAFGPRRGPGRFARGASKAKPVVPAGVQTKFKRANSAIECKPNRRRRAVLARPRPEQETRDGSQRQ